jgi:uncharacterized repeat protein (TIGR01451 family)
MFNFLRALRRGKNSVKRPQQKRRFVPRLEFLENRLAPSVSVVTDQADYLPGATAIFTGSGFDPGTTVQFQVVKTNVTPNVVESTWSVTDGSAADLDPPVDGVVQTSWYVDPAFSMGATFTLTATGVAGGVATTASAIFADSSSVDFTQFANKPLATPSTWINGILNANNSDYSEGTSTLQRALFTSLTGTSHTLVFRTEATKGGGNHAYDFLTSWTESEQAAAVLDPAAFWAAKPYTIPSPNVGVSDPGSSAPKNFQSTVQSLVNNNLTPAANAFEKDVTVPTMPTDPITGDSETVNQAKVNYEGLIGHTAFIQLFGDAAFDSMHPPTLTVSVETAGSDTYNVWTLTWTSSSANVLLLMAGHLAEGADGQFTGVGYGSGLGAGNINGGPYHFKLSTLDGSSLGSQDNQIQAGAIIALATPTLVSTPIVNGSSGNSFTLGSTPGVLNDSDTFANASASAGGTLTFTLHFTPAGSNTSTVVYTDNITVNGPGTYSTATMGDHIGGYTLPTTGAVVGSYQWDSHYTGDNNNHSADDINNPNELVTVNPASPSLVTTANPTGTQQLGTTAPTLNDSAVLSNGYFPTGTITFTLTYNNGTTTSTVYTDVITIGTNSGGVTGNGTYLTASMGNHAGGYTLPTSGAVTGLYKWTATYNDNLIPPNNNSASDNGSSTQEQVSITPASPSVSTTATPHGTLQLTTTSPTLNDSVVLSGGYFPTGTITFTLTYNNGTTTSTVYTDVITIGTNSGGVTGNGTYLTASMGNHAGGYTLPSSGSVTGLYKWTATYSDTLSPANNNSTTDDGSSTQEQVNVTPASPSVSTTATPHGTVQLTTTSPTLNDSVVLSGGYFPTGTITFTLTYNNGTTTSTVYTDVITIGTNSGGVTGNGTYLTASMGNHTGGYTLPTSGKVTGAYQWTATYTDNLTPPNNNTASDNGSSSQEQVNITPASPNLVTTPGATVVAGSGAALTDSANLSNGDFPTGTITFTLTAPAALGGGVVYTDVITIGVNSGGVTGNGTYTTAMGNNSGGYVPGPSAAGTYQWAASYSGDGHNNSTNDQGGSGEQETVTSAADLSIEKTDNVGGTFNPQTNNTTGGSQAPGKTIIYTIVVTNAGPSTAINQTVSDLLTTVVGLSSDTWTASASGGSSVIPLSGMGDINATVTVLPGPGTTVTFTVTANIAANASGTVVNTATVTQPPGDNTPNNNTSTDTVNLLTGIPGSNPDLSKVTDPEFIVTEAINTSGVTVFLQSIHDSLGNNLLAAPVAPVKSIAATLNGGQVSLAAGLPIPNNGILKVIETRTVQSTDPNPTVDNVTYTFNSNSSLTGQTFQVVSTDSVSLFHPSVTIGLSVDKPSASAGSTVTYTVTITNTSSANSPNLVFDNSSATLTKGSVTVTGLASTSIFHLVLNEAVMGAGVPVGTKIATINKNTNTITLSKAATMSGGTTLLFGFSATVAPPPGFQFSAADFTVGNLATLENFAPGDQVVFHYTHVVSPTPSPLVNTVDMYFYVADFGQHKGALAFNNRIHGPSNVVTTTIPMVVVSKIIFS